MSITREIFKNINEGVEIKKPYGDKPEEGKKEKLQKGSRIKVPKAKGNFEKYKARKLEAKNKNAETIYANDTDKVMDKIDSTEHSDKGKIAKINGKKSEKTIKFPFGDKVQASDSKLIKESSTDVPTIASKSEIQIGGLLDLGYKKVLNSDREIVLYNGNSSIVIEKGDPNYVTKYDSDDNFENFTKEEYNVLKDSKLINESSKVDHVFDYDIAKRFYDKYKSDKIGADFIMDYCSSKAFGKCNNELDPKSIDINSVQKELDGIVNSKKRK